MERKEKAFVIGSIKVRLDEEKREAKKVNRKKR